MVPTPSTSTELLPLAPGAPVKQQDWTHLIAAGTVLAGGALMVTGHKKVGMAMAAAGTALALLDEPAVIEGWWKNLPGYLNQAQDFLEKMEGYIEGVSTQGRRVQSLLRRG